MDDGAGHLGWEPAGMGRVHRLAGPHSASTQPKSLPSGSLPSTEQVNSKKETIKKIRQSGVMVRAIETSEQGLTGSGMVAPQGMLET